MPRSKVNRRKILTPIYSIIAGIVIGEIVVNVFLSHRSIIIVPPSDIAKALVNLWLHGNLSHHIWVSFVEFSIGFGLAVSMGIAVGVVTGIHGATRAVINPWVFALYATPIVAIAPLFIFVLGIGTISKVAIVFVVAVIPIMLNSQMGIRTVDYNLVEAGRSFGSSGWQIFAKILLPASVPSIIAGLQVGLARGLVGVVVGEMIGAVAGVGFLIFNSGQLFRTDEVFAGIVILMVAGTTASFLLNSLERKWAPWVEATHK